MPPVPRPDHADPADPSAAFAADAAPWAVFWIDAGVDGCTRGLPPALRGAITRRWQLLLAGLPPGASLLDLGCGRGAVLALARDAGITRLQGVDAAPITGTPFPLHVGSAAGLPYPDRAFTAVTSQFGVEYAGFATAVVEAARVAADRLWLLVHAADGPLHADAREQAAQAAWLAGPMATFERLAAHFRAPSPASVADIDALRTAIVDHAGAAGNTSLLEGVWRAISALQDVADPIAGTRDFAAGLAAHAARMQAMVAAAPTAADVADAAGCLRAAGFDVIVEDVGTPPAARWLLASRRPT
ncbi:class I SAM-dependent methyltransferase [Sandarakinorhabdus sp. DWP1-3-1]|uniref:class I SAM-dependent methyltransferase n=1 Tax=Sandarakinorhabdus sp. DWP1-3-1 TaxID=2804627 RepID=UPI003CF8CD91